jgi:hypothetical protein
MERITKQMIERLIDRAAELSGLPQTKEQAIAKGVKHYLQYEYASVYNGYRLIMVGTENGGHSGAFGMPSIEPRKNAKEFYSMLQGIIAGLSTK